MNHDRIINLNQLIFRIGETTKITGVSARQLRYWDQKGYIKSKRVDENSSRVYTFFSLLRILMIKDLLNDGYTLSASIQKVDQRQNHLNRLHDFFSNAYQGIKRIDNKTMIDLGYLDPKTHQKLYGYLDDDGNVKYKTRIE